MSLRTGETWQHGQIKLQGLSLSGIRTGVVMPEHNLAFDTAQGYPYLLNLKNYFVTHGHLDHAAGIPYILSQKAMTRQEKPRFFMPPSLVEPMTRIMNTWEEIEKHRYAYDFIPFKPDDKFELNSQFFVKAFPAVHRIEANGYTLFEVRRKLKAEYQGLSREELGRLGREGAQLNEAIEIPLVSFTGDTQIEYLDRRDWVRKSKVLVTECTYIDSKKSVATAREWGHLHLDELIPRLDDIESEKIVLIHLSSRYTTQEALKVLDEKVPAKHRDRIEIFPGR